MAGAIFWTKKDSNQDINNIENRKSAPQNPMELIRAVDENDHVMGDPNAPVKIVEYSDFECPYCKIFHPVMKMVMEEYGKTGQVAWVYRHFPIYQLHPIKAHKEAVASECAAELGGNTAFWEFADRFFEITPSNNKTDIDTVLPKIATGIGLDGVSFNECLKSGKYDEHVREDIKNAKVTGGRGTPWSIVISSSGKKYPINGAQPYDSVKAIIESALYESQTQ